MSFMTTQQRNINGNLVQRVIATQRQINGVRVVQEKTKQFVPASAPAPRSNGW